MQRAHAVDSDARVAEGKRLQSEFTAREMDMDAGGAASMSQYSDLPPLPFKSDDQQIFLVNLAHRQQQPRCQVPAFRVLGAFPDKNALMRHVKSVGIENFGGAALHVVEAHKKAVICSTLEKQQNNTYVMNKVEESTKIYTNMLDFHSKEFAENRQKKQQGKTGLSQKEKVAQKTKSSRQLLLEEKFNEFKSKANEAGTVSRMAEVRNQSFVVASIIDDMSPAVLKNMEDPEPLVILWQCFDSEAEAKRYIMGTAQEKVRDVSMDIFNMYEWVYPTEINVDVVNEQFRDPRLDKIMKARKRTKANVMNFEQWCAKEGKEAPVLEIEATPDETKVKPLELGNTMTVSTVSQAVEIKEEVDGNNLDAFKPMSGRIESSKYHTTTFIQDGLKSMEKEEIKEIQIEEPKSIKMIPLQPSKPAKN